jgi:hypothetical protein
VGLSVRDELFWQASSSNKIIVASLQIMHGGFFQDVELQNLCDSYHRPVMMVARIFSSVFMFNAVCQLLL